MRIEAVPGCRLIRSVDAKAVELAGLQIGKVAVPDLVGPLGQRDPLGFLDRARRIEQAQLDLRRMFREEGEVDARAVPGCAERIRRAAPDTHVKTPEVQ